MHEKLSLFVEHARAQGMDHATIRQMLLSVGWKDKDVAQIFCAGELELPIPSPPASVGVSSRPRKRSGSVWPRRARDAFFHLLTFGALYTWATSLILLFFTYFDFMFPDPAWRTTYGAMMEAMSIIRAQLAIVIVAFPIFLILWHFLLREVRSEPGKSNWAIRRWLTYLSIFVGALTLSGDAMTLIYFLLEGQLTVRLLLKTATLFLIAGGLVLYLVMTLRSEKEEAE